MPLQILRGKIVQEKPGIKWTKIASWRSRYRTEGGAKERRTWFVKQGTSHNPPNPPNV